MLDKLWRFGQVKGLAVLTTTITGVVLARNMSLEDRGDLAFILIVVTLVTALNSIDLVENVLSRVRDSEQQFLNLWLFILSTSAAIFLLFLKLEKDESILLLLVPIYVFLSSINAIVQSTCIRDDMKLYQAMSNIYLIGTLFVVLSANFISGSLSLLKAFCVFLIMEIILTSMFFSLVRIRANLMESLRMQRRRKHLKELTQAIGAIMSSNTNSIRLFAIALCLKPSEFSLIYVSFSMIAPLILLPTSIAPIAYEKQGLKSLFKAIRGRQVWYVVIFAIMFTGFLYLIVKYFSDLIFGPSYQGLRNNAELWLIIAILITLEKFANIEARARRRFVVDMLAMGVSSLILCAISICLSVLGIRIDLTRAFLLLGMSSVVSLFIYMNTDKLRTGRLE